MSFSFDVKEELSKIKNLKDKESVLAEFKGYMINKRIETNKNIEYATENEYNINRFIKLLKNIGIEKYNIQVKGNNYIVTFKNNLKIESINLSKEVLEKAYIRGVLMGNGSINEPKNNYHLEINIKEDVLVDKISKILNKYGIEVKRIRKSNGNSVYIKDGDEISKFLAFIGANTSVLKFEEARVLRDMRNNVNRIVNCETANLNKTAQASAKQIQAIKIIQKYNEFNKIPEQLQEVAKLRLENPEATLAELGHMLTEKIGKSGINHRLKSIEKIAEEITKKLKKP